MKPKIACGVAELVGGSVDKREREREAKQLENPCHVPHPRRFL